MLVIGLVLVAHGVLVVIVAVTMMFFTSLTISYYHHYCPRSRSPGRFLVDLIGQQLCQGLTESLQQLHVTNLHRFGLESWCKHNGRIYSWLRKYYSWESIATITHL